jgi:transcription initiation factor TFIID subunit TAF12
MDYGPTIAAAFGSYDPTEVDACREAIVECMKNTPLDNGIRATGAVKEHHERQQAAMYQQQLEQQREQQQQQQNQTGGGERYQNYQLPPGAAQRARKFS